MVRLRLLAAIARYGRSEERRVGKEPASPSRSMSWADVVVLIASRSMVEKEKPRLGLSAMVPATAPYTPAAVAVKLPLTAVIETMLPNATDAPWKRMLIVAPLFSK